MCLPIPVQQANKQHNQMIISAFAILTDMGPFPLCFLLYEPVLSSSKSDILSQLFCLDAEGALWCQGLMHKVLMYLQYKAIWVILG